VIVQAAAKINLALRVLGRRGDGYHEIETVFHTVGLWDRLRLTLLPDPGRVTLEVDTPEVPSDESNLCWRSAKLLADREQPDEGAAIKLGKSIPVQAGLGGGSADAAAALVGLERLWGLDLEPSVPSALAAQVGADVPFFLQGGCCLARGRGEKLERLCDIKAWLVLVVPESRVPTVQAYAVLGRGSTRGRRRRLDRTTQRVVAALEAGDVGSLAGSLHNDFEAADLPGIAEAMQAKEDLLAQADRVAAAVSAEWHGVRGVATVGGGHGLVISDQEAG
jgi:4-diphosphocytidyl-2-C-methyl-D-erythritol kinase